MSTDSVDRVVEIRRTISHFDLTAADNPGAVISRPLLREKKYDEWVCAFKTALCSRKKFGFLDGSISKPLPSSPDYEDWEPINALLVSWIKMTIEPTLLSHISHRDNAKDLWDHIRKRFAVTSGPKMQQIKSDLATCRQNSRSIDEYFGRLTKIWDNLAAYRPLRLCKCDACTCDLATQLERDREEDQVHQFLFGLNDRMYSSLRSTLTSRVPLPGLEEVYNLIKQEEDMQTSSRLREEKHDVTAFATQITSRLNEGRVRNVSTVCKHCNKTGHLAENCFAVIGYPEWWGDRPRSRVAQQQGKGKPSNNGPYKPPVLANVVSAVPPPTHNTTSISIDADHAALLGVTDEKWRAIRQVLNAGPNTSSETFSGMCTSPSWILDTGCTHHMTGKLSVLSNLRNISPVMVILADGTERLSVREGSVVLGSHLVLESVFYVEELKTDLVSLGQLMNETNSV